MLRQHSKCSIESVTRISLLRQESCLMQLEVRSRESKRIYPEFERLSDSAGNVFDISFSRKKTECVVILLLLNRVHDNLSSFFQDMNLFHSLSLSYYLALLPRTPFTFSFRFNSLQLEDESNVVQAWLRKNKTEEVRGTHKKVFFLFSSQESCILLHLHQLYCTHSLCKYPCVKERMACCLDCPNQRF